MPEYTELIAGTGPAAGLLFCKACLESPGSPWTMFAVGSRIPTSCRRCGRKFINIDRWDEAERILKEANER